MKEIKVTKRGKRYGFYYRVPGYPKAFYESYATEEEAKLRASELNLQKLRGTICPPYVQKSEKMPTLGELLERYVEEHGRERWGDSQYSVVTRQIRDYILPSRISSLLLKDITTVEVDRFLNELLRTPAVLRKGHADKSKTVGIYVVEKIRATLRAAFNQAIAWGYVSNNPVAKSTLPKVKRQKRTYWTPTEAQQALTECKSETLRICMLLAIGCSMRIGEILGLQWSNVDLKERESPEDPSVLLVRQELKRCDVYALEQTADRDEIYYRFPPCDAAMTCKTVLVLKAPKTESSVRTLYIPATVAAALRTHRDLQNEEKRKAGEVYRDHDLVIAQPDGRPVEERFVSKELAELIAETQLPKVVFHSLRHLSTSLKLKYSGGDIKAVQGDTGHAQADMVTNVYSEIFHDDRRALAGKMESNFFEKVCRQDTLDEATTPEILAFQKLLAEKPEAAKSLLTLLGNVV